MDHQAIDACTIGAASGAATADGSVLVWSNSDDPFTTRTRLVVVEPDDGYRFIATQIISPPPPVSFNEMHTRGLNSAGFAYTWAYVMPSTEPNDREAIGVPLNQFGRLLLSQAATIDDALALVERYPRAYHGNFLFADARGEIALVEISTKTMHVETRARDGVIARANHWISDVMVPVGSPEFRESSVHRYQRACDLIGQQQGSISVESLTAITADQEGHDRIGVSICARGNPNGDRPFWGGTVSSEIIEPSKGRFWYCYGWPGGPEPESPEQQLYQDRSWGTYLPFDLADLEPGEYVTTDGRITPLAVKYLRSGLMKEVRAHSRV